MTMNTADTELYTERLILIKRYHERARADFPEKSLTRNQIQKLFFKHLRDNDCEEFDSEKFEVVFQKRLKAHREYWCALSNEDFYQRPELVLGEVNLTIGVTLATFTLKSKEHLPIIYSCALNNYKDKIKLQLANYATEWSCKINLDELFSKGNTKVLVRPHYLPKPLRESLLNTGCIAYEWLTDEQKADPKCINYNPIFSLK